MVDYGGIEPAKRTGFGRSSLLNTERVKTSGDLKPWLPLRQGAVLRLSEAMAEDQKIPNPGARVSGLSRASRASFSRS